MVYEHGAGSFGPILREGEEEVLWSEDFSEKGTPQEAFTGSGFVPSEPFGASAGPAGPMVECEVEASAEQDSQPNDARCGEATEGPALAHTYREVNVEEQGQRKSRPLPGYPQYTEHNRAQIRAWANGVQALRRSAVYTEEDEEDPSLGLRGSSL